jgi:hypothetical protein
LAFMEVHTAEIGSPSISISLPASKDYDVAAWLQALAPIGVSCDPQGQIEGSAHIQLETFEAQPTGRVTDHEPVLKPPSFKCMAG